MGIARFFDTDVVVRRLRTVSGDRKSFQATATVDGHIQELPEERRQILGIVEGNAFVGYFQEDADVTQGDTLTDQNTGDRYEVKEVQKKDYAFGINQHIEVVLLRIQD